MGIEIEKKFLLNRPEWEAIKKPKPLFFRQGYLSTDPNKTIRVRETDTQGFLTIKGISTGATRAEFEYEIPKSEAAELLDNFSDSDLTKHRYLVVHAGKTWEVDEFLGKNEGLFVAEIELENENEAFEIPDWIGKEVTGEVQYYNSNLSIRPFSTWQP